MATYHVQLTLGATMEYPLKDLPDSLYRLAINLTAATDQTRTGHCTMSLRKIAKTYGRTVEQARQDVEALVSNGLVLYDEDTENVSVSPILFWVFRKKFDKANEAAGAAKDFLRYARGLPGGFRYRQLLVLAGEFDRVRNRFRKHTDARSVAGVQQLDDFFRVELPPLGFTNTDLAKANKLALLPLQDRLSTLASAGPGQGQFDVSLTSARCQRSRSDQIISGVVGSAGAAASPGVGR